MTDLKTYFKDFLYEIRLTPDQVKDLKNEHENLRQLLKEDEQLSKIIVDTFLQGSYRRSTIIRPKNQEDNPDVDVVVVTNLDKDSYTPSEALEMFEPFLKEHYKDKYRVQGRSLGICLENVDLDLVVTAIPSESEKDIGDMLEKSGIFSDLNIEDVENEMINFSSRSTFKSAKKIKTFFKAIKNSPDWKDEPLYIPDRDAGNWERTHPLEQIRWTDEKNELTNKHYINVVKALKWWRKEKHPDTDQPKSYPLEHFIGFCCPNNIDSVAEGVTLTLEQIRDYHTDKPELSDHGVPDHDVFARISPEEYQRFYIQVKGAATIARHALDSADKKESIEKWKELFGDKFPPYRNNKNSKSGGFKRRVNKTSNMPGGKFS